MKKPKVKVRSSNLMRLNGENSRRRFLKMGGLAVVGSSMMLYSCSSDDDLPGTPEPTEPPQEIFDLGSGDVGVLNYAYALEQLEAAFYEMVMNGNYFSGAPDNEKQIIEDLYNHEVIHREFLREAISGVVDEDQVLPELEFDFEGVDFNSRDSVLQYAQILEDTGVQAYNGAGSLLSNTDYLLLAGKIVSVEARHASAIRDLIAPGTTNFASDDVLVDLGGSGVAYDKATPPEDVLAAVGETGFIQTEFTANELPNS